MTLHAPPRPVASTPQRRFLPGLAALVLLAAFIAIPPLGLISFVGNPVPDQAVIGGRLTDDAVIGMLAAVVWVAWAQLMLVVLVETAAALRGATMPTLPLCGPQQQLVRKLVVTAVFLLVGSATANASYAGTSASAVVAEVCTANAPVSTAAPVAAQVDGPEDRRRAPAPRPIPAAEAGSVQTSERADRTETREAGRWYTVKPPQGRNHDTLWDIAERHLGDGLRWKDIYKLNRDRSQGGGQRLEAADLIHPGWRLLLPADARGLPEDGADERPARPKAPRERAEPSSEDAVAGQPGKKAGQPSKKDTAQPSASSERNTSARGESADAGATVSGSGGASTGPPASADSTTAGRPAEPQAAQVPAPAAVHATEWAADPTTADPVAADPVAVDEEEPSIPFGAVTLGFSAVAAAALTAELSRRRRRAQRFRRPGERLRTPAPEETRVERQLRTANAEITVGVLRDALRRLAAACHHADRPLPEVQAVLLNAERATLHLGCDEAEAIAPFTATGPRRWELTGTAASSVLETEDDPVDPYPALVSLGTTTDAVLLVNLEAAGTLHVEGPAEVSAEVAHAIAAELGTSALTATVELVLAGAPTELAAITDAGRTHALTSAAAARWIDGRQCAIAAALRESGLDDLAQARGRRLASDLWVPAVLVDTSGAEASPTPFRATRYGGVAVVTTAAPATDDSWTLRADGDTWRLDPADIEVTPQRLTASRRHTVVGLLAVSTEAPPATAPANGSAGAPTPERPRSTLTITRSTNGTTSPIPTQLPVVTAEIPAPRPETERQSSTETAAPALPRVHVVGQVEIAGVAAIVASNRRRRSVELIAYLALHPGATQHQIDEALWPGKLVPPSTRNPVVSRARSWLGTATDDNEPRLRYVSEGGHYILHPEVGCDWRDFEALAERGLAAGADGIVDLVAAMDLVRGRPFLGIKPSRYTWAEGDIQDMISAIVDVAHALAERSADAGDHRRSRWAAGQALAVDPCSDLALQDAIRAATALGDTEDVNRLVDAARARLADLDPDDDVEMEADSLTDRRTSS